MAEVLEIGPLEVLVSDSEVRFGFADPTAVMLEIPPTFEEQLRDVALDRQEEFQGKSAIIDLSDLPAISSRQLGMILTIREVMKPFGTLRLIGTSNSVRHFLRMTGTERLFELDP